MTNEQTVINKLITLLVSYNYATKVSSIDERVALSNVLGEELPKILKELHASEETIRQITEVETDYKKQLIEKIAETQEKFITERVNKQGATTYTSEDMVENCGAIYALYTISRATLDRFMSVIDASRMSEDEVATYQELIVAAKTLQEMQSSFMKVNTGISEELYRQIIGRARLLGESILVLIKGAISKNNKQNNEEKIW